MHESNVAIGNQAAIESKSDGVRAVSHWAGLLGPLIPLLSMLACLPYTLVYFANLWQLPHYQFFPLPLAAVVYLARDRWGGLLGGSWWFRLFRNLLLASGIFAGLCATVFASPWMGYFGFAVSAASWFACRADRQAGGSLFYLAIPLLLLWQPPYNSIVTADTILIQNLQSLSARLSSQWLDIMGYAHHQPGTVLEFAGRSFGVAEACSGIQSFFAVLCLGALLVAFYRRGPVHSALLLGTSPCWALLMNTIRITAIPVAYAWFGLDLSHGVLHDLLGYCTMGLALALLVSTDELLLKLAEYLPVSLTFNRTHSAAKSTASNWPPLLRWLAWTPLLILFSGFFLLQANDVKDSWGHQRDVIDFFRGAPLLQMSFEDAPQELAGWQQSDYNVTTRERGNDDLGQRSDRWRYQAPFGTVSLSFDQMFPGWHELTRCYRNAGWQVANRSVIGPNEEVKWPVVLVQMTRGQEQGYLLFSLINRSGRPLQPPDDFTYWTILQERLQGRLTPAVRGALFGVSAYQMQLFATTTRPLNDVQKAEMLQRFLPAREQLWSAAAPRLEEQAQ